MAWIYLLIIVTINTLQWPLNRWMSRTNSVLPIYAFWLYLSATLVALVTLIITSSSFITGSTWIFAIIAGVCNAVSFLALLYCLNIGPASLTILISNLCIVCPIAFEIIIFKLHISSILVFSLSAIIIGLIIIALSNKGKDSSHFKTDKDRIRWLLISLLVWLSAGISYTFQLANSRYNPDTSTQYVFFICLTSALITLLYSIRFRKTLFLKREIIAGATYGVAFNMTIILTFLALKVISSAVVFPVILTIPIILVMLIGVIRYKERISRLGWIGCFIIIAGIIGLQL